MATLPISKAYLITQLRNHEIYMLWDKKTRTIIDTPEHYVACTSTDPGAIQITDATFLATVQETLPTAQIGDYVQFVPAVTHTEEYYARRYRLADESYTKTETDELISNSALAEWKANTAYGKGFCVIYDNKLYTANVAHTSGTTFDSSKWDMVGAASIFNFVDALPATSTLTEDQAFILKADEYDSATPPTLLHKKGLWLFDNTTKTYSLYHEYETSDLDFAKIFNSSATPTYTGNLDEVVNSSYLYNQLKTLGDKLYDEIIDLYDIVDHPTYIILDNKAALDAYDLSTLEDNSVAIFLVKEDESDPISGTDPVEYYSTLYMCIANDEATKTRTVHKIGRLNYGEHGLDKIIEEAIHDALYIKTVIAAYYKKAASGLTIVADGTKATEIEIAEVAPTVGSLSPVIGMTVDAVTAYQKDSTGTGLVVVADGSGTGSGDIEISKVTPIIDGDTITIGDFVTTVTAYQSGTTLTIVADGLKDTQIEISDVNPVESGYTPAIGDIVEYVPASTVEIEKYIKRSELEVNTLAKISNETVEETEAGVTTSINYLTYNSKQLLYNEFETKSIDFNSDEYQDIVPNATI